MGGVLLQVGRKAGGGRRCLRHGNDDLGPGPRASRLPRVALSSWLARHSLYRGFRHLSKARRRRREVREAVQASLLLQEEAAGVLLGVALGTGGRTRVAHLPLPDLAPAELPRQDAEGGLPRGAHVPAIPQEAALPLVAGDDGVQPHVQLLRPRIAVGVARAERVVLKPQPTLLGPVQSIPPGRHSESHEILGASGRGWVLGSGGCPARGHALGGPPVGRRASRRGSRRSSGGLGNGDPPKPPLVQVRSQPRSAQGPGGPGRLRVHCLWVGLRGAVASRAAAVPSLPSVPVRTPTSLARSPNGTARGPSDIRVGTRTDGRRPAPLHLPPH